MMKPILLLLMTILVLEIGDIVFGYQGTYRIGYGAFSLLALVIALTFLWLWRQRATPLALGMVFSWTGAAGVMAWWWLFSILKAPVWMQDNPILFVFLALYLTGAVLHLEVIGRSFALSRLWTYFPVVGAALLSWIASVLV
ncbi:MAG: hypothetical protein ACU0GG_13065 [Paracoccaceae bacterium]